MDKKYKKRYSDIVVILRSMVAIIALLGGTIVFFLYTTKFSDEIREDSLNYEKEIRWNKIEAIMFESYSNALLTSKTTSETIIKRLAFNYKDNMVGLKEELHNPKPDNKSTDIFYEAISNKYFAGIETSSNTQFVITKDFVLADSNINNIKRGRSEKGIRDIPNEINGYENPDLAREAFTKLTSKEPLPYNEPIFLQSANRKHKEIFIDEMNIESLRKAYYKYGIEALKDVRFLVPSYILENSDIFGIPDNDKFGNAVDNDKIIVVQRFNLYEVLKGMEDQEVLFSEIDSTPYIVNLDKKLSTLNYVLKGVLVVSITIFIAFILNIKRFINRYKQNVRDSLYSEIEDYEKNLFK